MENIKKYEEIYGKYEQDESNLHVSNINNKLRLKLTNINIFKRRKTPQVTTRKLKNYENESSITKKKFVKLRTKL